MKIWVPKAEIITRKVKNSGISGQHADTSAYWDPQGMIEQVDSLLVQKINAMVVDLYRKSNYAAGAASIALVPTHLIV